MMAEQKKNYFNIYVHMCGTHNFRIKGWQQVTLKQELECIYFLFKFQN